MPTAALIDLNHLALKHLDDAKFYLRGDNYDSATASLHSVNAALPPEYQIKFDTDEYNRLIKHPLEIYCKKCGEMHNRDEIQIWNLLLPLNEQILAKDKTTKAWSCAKCDSVNILLESKLVQKVREEPYFTKVVPMPPERKQSFGDRTSFHIHYRAWFGNVVAELTRAISQLRWDHWKQGDEDNLNLAELKEALSSNLESSF